MSLVDIALALDFFAADAMRLIPVEFGPSRMPRPSAIVSRFPDRRMIRKRIAPHYYEHWSIRTCLHSDMSVALRQAQDVLGEVVEDHLLRNGRDLVEAHLAPEPLHVELLG